MPRLIKAGDLGKVQPGLKFILTDLRRRGLDLGSLEGWIPDAQELARLRRAQDLMAMILNPYVAERGSLIAELQELLSVLDPRWRLLRQMADAAAAMQRVRPDLKPPTRMPAASGPKAGAERGDGRRLKEARERLAQGAAVHPRSVADFGRNARSLSIYIDESWSESADEPRGGHLAGLVWIGDAPDEAVLPRIDTHLLRAHNPRTAGPSDLRELQTKVIEALDRVLQCPRAFPFIMSVRLDDGAGADPYDRMVASCLQVLLGWLLPTDGPQATVSVYLERYGRYGEGSDGTSFFRGLLAGTGQMNSKRFGRWSLKAVQWKEKEFGYIPYGDLFAYLALENTRRGRQIGKVVNFKSWPGYVPLSLELIPRLFRLEHVEQTQNVQDLLDLVRDLGDAPLCRLVLDDFRRRLDAHPVLGIRLLQAMDERYREKSRNLEQLRVQLDAVRRLVPAPGLEAGFRIRLLYAALDLQDANHDGDPDRVRERALAYLGFRKQAAEHDRELAAFVDLILAVHHADRFEFGEAQLLVEDLIFDPLFPALTPLTRGWAYSSLGQYQAMQRRWEDAELRFQQALAQYDLADLTPEARARERHQTGCYRALNALDGGLPGAIELLEAVIGPIDKAAKTLAVDADPASAYHQHLLLRALWMHQGLDAARSAYLACQDDWKAGKQHPWPLIFFYRALLLCDRGTEGTDAAEPWFVQAITVAEARPHGVTLQLIGAMIATVAHCCNASYGADVAARMMLDEVEPKLHAAATAIRTLRDVLERPHVNRIDEALEALPFNFH